MKRILLPNGKFAPFKSESKKVVSMPSVTIEEKKDEKPVEDTSEESVEKKSFTLTGDETVAELKALLDEAGVKYAKNAGKDKCLELIAPFLTEEESVDDEL